MATNRGRYGILLLKIQCFNSNLVLMALGTLIFKTIEIFKTI